MKHGYWQTKKSKDSSVLPHSEFLLMLMIVPVNRWSDYEIYLMNSQLA